MHLSLSDLVTCPRCGPSWGLILLPQAVHDRRVERGVLGCPNCRERYGIEGGVGDLRVPGLGVPGGEPPGPTWGGDPEESAVRLAALLGLAESRGTLLTAGVPALTAGALAALLEGVEVVAVGGPEVAEAGGGVGLTRLLVGRTLPFRDGSLLGVALLGSWSALVEEGLRAVRPTGRVLLEPADAALAARAEAGGGARLVEEAGTLVVTRRA